MFISAELSPLPVSEIGADNSVAVSFVRLRLAVIGDARRSNTIDYGSIPHRIISIRSVPTL